jgi:hypothetical protein
MEYNRWIFSLYAEAVASATALNALARGQVHQGEGGRGQVAQSSRWDMNYFNRVWEVNGNRITDLVGVGGTLRGKRGKGEGVGAWRRGGERDGRIVDIAFPVFVLNMEHRKDRREHMLLVYPRAVF